MICEQKNRENTEIKCQLFQNVEKKKKIEKREKRKDKIFKKKSIKAKNSIHK